MTTYHILSQQGGQLLAVSPRPGVTLAQSLYVAGAFSGRALCSGMGRCGLCQVRFIENAPPPLPAELDRVSAQRLAAGVRLTCLRGPVDGAVVEAALDLAPPDFSGCPPRRDGCSLGVDLGTTSIHWRLLCAGSVLAQGQTPNPQMGAGTDVMARMALALHHGGAERLRLAVLKALGRILSGLPAGPERICLAGNSAMTYLAFGLDVSGLAGAPYALGWAGGAHAVLDPWLDPVYVPPLVAPFVGADISAGLAGLALGPTPPPAPWLLADLGTNGEFALALEDGTMLLASVPMGPALEGVGMRDGMLAGPGAAVGFVLTPAGLAPRMYGGGQGEPAGASGTGYISLVSVLRTLGVLQPDGRVASVAANPLAGRVLARMGVDRGEPCLDACGVKLWAADVESLLKVKAAFNAAVHYLLERAGLPFSALRAVRLAGALGEHVRIEDLETLGFLPPGAASITAACGNTSLDGACLAASSPEARGWLDALPARCSLVDVVGAPGFQDMYLSAMRFTYVD